MRKASVLKEEFLNGSYDPQFLELYMEEGLLPVQRERYAAACANYIRLFGDGMAGVYNTPGRSEIGGNHTDHQHGMVLAASVNLDIIAIASPCNRHEVCIKSEGYDLITVPLSDLRALEEDVGEIRGLIKGIAQGFLNDGYQIGGFQAYIESNVLIGSGLSSSAAFEVLIGTIFSQLFQEGAVPPPVLAKIAQFAENQYFQKPCGLMDQMACSVGGLIQIDFFNTAEPSVRKIAMHFKDFGHSLCIVDTKGSHNDLTEEYAAIPQEMSSVAACFGKTVLREVDEDQFYKELPLLREKLGDRCILRAIHFFEEEHRVASMGEALQKDDFGAFKDLIRKSGHSSFKYLQNIYSNADVQHQDMSIALAVSERTLGVHGVSRVHGGGFAGTIQAFVEDGYVHVYREAMDAVFGAGACRVLKIRSLGSLRLV